MKDISICFIYGIFLLVVVFACSEEPKPARLNEAFDEPEPFISQACDTLVFDYKGEAGCDGRAYLDPNSSPYIIPFDVNAEFKMGLCNCSSSYHASGRQDQYAYDFDFKEGTSFIAARKGTVIKIIEDQSSTGGGIGNLLIIDHGDGTYGHYLHSPMDGIYVNYGDIVKQGQELGIVGASGLAGYPHLHFVVTEFGYLSPYTSIPISFNNVVPPVVVLESFSSYSICK